MYRVILQPCGDAFAEEHYEATIKKSVSINTIASVVSDEILEEIKALSSNNRIAAWGVTPGNKDVNRNKWEKIQSGDITLFSSKGRIFSSGVVSYKIHNKDLALKLWGTNKTGETWEYMYFIDELKNVNIPYSLFNKVVGYKSNYIIQGFSILDEEKSENIINYFDLASETYTPEITKKDFEQIVKEFDPNAPLDAYGRIRVRKEQSFLRKYLFNNKIFGVCGICGNEYPVNLLIASHIKKRSECSDQEKLDYKNIIMPMCKLGCDDLFEKGYITVSDSKVCKIKGKPLTKALKNYINQIDERECSYWSDNSKKYFEWHKGFHS